MTEQQRKWFASVLDGLQLETGARRMGRYRSKCPETGTRARLKWFEDTYGLLQNRARHVFSEAFSSAVGWDEPDALREKLGQTHRPAPSSMQLKS